MSRIFPINPEIGDTASVGQNIFTWNGSRWGKRPNPAVQSSQQPPENATEGTIWFNTELNSLKVFDGETFISAFNTNEIIGAIVGQAPETLDTLEELAASLGDDPNFATTITNALAGKAPVTHTHSVSDVTNLQTTLDGKAATSHTHAISEVTNLQASLDGKANLSGATFTGAIQGNVRQSVTNRTANFSITSAMAGTVQRFTSTSNLTITIANVFSIGDRIDILRDNTGEVTIAAGSGVTLVSPGTKRRLNERYSAATVICVASGVYHIIGDLKV